MSLFTSRSGRRSSRREVADALCDALASQGVRFRRLRRRDGWVYRINGQDLAPWQAAEAYLPGGWWAFYDQLGGGR
jgi:hypothetical protein